jgi:RHS repeat-associated protein
LPYVLNINHDSKLCISGYPFGQLVPNRHGSSDTYRYGFNGMEKDNELKGEGNSYDFGARMLDPRVGRWFARDPKEGKNPNLSPYNTFENNPIVFIDPEGKDAIITIKGNTITVKAVIYIDNSGKNKMNAAKVQKDIMKVWGGNHKDSSGKYNVKFDVVVMEKPQALNPFSASNIAGNLPDNHPMGVDSRSTNFVLPQEKGYRSNVSGYSYGSWMVGENDNTYAHEFGHMLGLADRYLDFVPDPLGAKTRNGFAVVDTRTQEEKDYYFAHTPPTSIKVDGDKSTDLMENSATGKVSQLSIDSIVNFALTSQKNGTSVINSETLSTNGTRNGLAAPTADEQIKIIDELKSRGGVRVPTK